MDTFYSILTIAGMIVLVVIPIVTGWKSVSQFMGDSNFLYHLDNIGNGSSFWFGARLMRVIFSALHFVLKVVLSVLLGYIFCIINIVKFIMARVARAKEKKAASINVQNSSNVQNTSVQNTSGEDTTNV